MAKKKRAVRKAQPAARTSKKEGDGKLFAWIATFFSIIGFLVALLAKRENKYVMFYAKQSLVIFIVSVVLAIISAILAFIPILGWIINLAANILIFVLWLFSWIYALSGKEKETPLVGQYGRKFNF